MLAEPLGWGLHAALGGRSVQRACYRLWRSSARDKQLLDECLSPIVESLRAELPMFVPPLLVALLALLHDEPGAELVQAAVDRGAISTVNCRRSFGPCWTAPSTLSACAPTSKHSDSRSCRSRPMWPRPLAGLSERGSKGCGEAPLAHTSCSSMTASPPSRSRCGRSFAIRLAPGARPHEPSRLDSAASHAF